MADYDDIVSMVGTAPRRRPVIDEFAWGRAALHFARISVEEHEELAQKLGVGAAGEVLLLVIAKQCGTDPRKWQQARDLGIPWQAKSWTSLTGLQKKKLQRRCGQSTEAAHHQPGCCPFGLIHSRLPACAMVGSSGGADPPPSWTDSADIEGG